MIGLPTPRSTLRAQGATRWPYPQRDADLRGLIEIDHGDVPLVELRWRRRGTRPTRHSAKSRFKRSFHSRRIYPPDFTDTASDPADATRGYPPDSTDDSNRLNQIAF